MDPKQWHTEHTNIQGMPGPLDLRHPSNHLTKKLSLYEVPQKSGGRRTARRVLSTQAGTEQLGMRRTTMSEIAPREWATRSRYAEWTQSPEGTVVKKEPDNQEGTKGRRGHRSGGRVLNGEKGVGWSGRRPATSRGQQGYSV